MQDSRRAAIAGNIHQQRRARELMMRSVGRGLDFDRAARFSVICFLSRQVARIALGSLPIITNGVETEGDVISRLFHSKRSEDGALERRSRSTVIWSVHAFKTLLADVRREWLDWPWLYEKTTRLPRSFHRPLD